MSRLTHSEHGHGEHPLLGVPRRDAITVAVLSVLTVAFFVCMKVPGAARTVQSIDDAFLRSIADARSPALTAVAEGLDLLGSAYVTIPLRIVLAAFLALRRRWWHFVAFTAAVVVSELTIGYLKALYDRPRPPGALVATSGASFPSGHAIAASVTAVALVIALFGEGPRRYWWGALAALFSLVMALSRTYLAAHWLSDAVAGVFLGVTVALGVALVVHHMQRVADEPRGGDIPDIVASRE